MKNTVFISKITQGVDPGFWTERRALTSRERVAKWRAKQSVGGIGSLPPTKDPGRRDACRFDFRLFLETYKKAEFCLEWSDDHLRVINRIERVVLKGELYALAMPRGSGKTSLCEAGSQWAAMYGHKRFIVYIGADKEAATRSLDAIKVDLETNELLAEDFPEICVPVQKLEGLAQRAHSQTYMGEQTRIRWSTDKVVLPQIEGSEASGVRLMAFGLTGSIRGAKHKKADGTSERPDLVVIDDPQTDATAASLSQNNTRVRLLSGAVLKLAGPGKKIAGIMPCTVIQREDMADQILDRAKFPRWQGDRMKAVYTMPKNLELWEEYRQAWQDGLREEDGGKAGNAFYKKNRKKLDAGAVVAWKERIEEGDLSALQSCMNFYLEDEHGFLCEYQNEPPDEFNDPDNRLHTEGLRERCNGIELRTVPSYCTKIVAFADVGTKTGINFVVLAAGEHFTGAIIDYGRISVAGGQDEDAAIWEALTKFASRVSQPYQSDAGGEINISTAGIDAAWKTELVYRFCRESQHSNLLIPCRGAYVKPGGRLYSSKDKSAIRGTEYIYANVRDTARPIRLMRYNSNFWRSFGMQRMKLPIGSQSGISINGKSQRHKMLFEHLTSEIRTMVTVEGKVYPIWSMIPNRENHLWDSYIGTCVLAQFNGLDPMGKAHKSGRTGRTRRKFVRA